MKLKNQRLEPKGGCRASEKKIVVVALQKYIRQIFTRLNVARRKFIFCSLLSVLPYKLKILRSSRLYVPLAYYKSIGSNCYSYAQRHATQF
jgi:hypothetical protein